MAFDANGLITAVRVSGDYNVGAYVAPSAGVPPMFFTFLMSGVYAIPAIDVTTRCRYTNTNGTAPYRGAGAPRPYVLERLIELGAKEMGMDAIEIRRKNLIKSDQMPYQTALIYAYDSGEFENVMDDALDKADWSGFAARRQRSETAGKLRGIGLSSYGGSGAVQRAHGYPV